MQDPVPLSYKKNLTRSTSRSADTDELKRNPRFPPPEEESEELEIAPEDYASLMEWMGLGAAQEPAEAENKGRFLWPFSLTISKSKGGHDHQ